METHASNQSLDVETSPFSAEDYVQMACQLRRSAEMHIRYADGRSGGIIVNKGELWHAWDSLGGGDEAFLRMVGNARVTKIRSLASSDRTSRSITQSCQKLLLQALIACDTQNATKAVARAEASPKNVPAKEDPDSELTRPDWRIPRAATVPSGDTDPEAVTTRSYTERPVELDATSPAKPRGIATFLRQPSNVQRAGAALFGSILVVSVAQILATPAGGAQAHAAKVEQPPGPQRQSSQKATPGSDVLSPVNADGTAQRAPEATLAAERGSAGTEPVLQVSALKTVGSLPRGGVLTRVHDVAATGDYDVNAVARHTMRAASEFANCYDWAHARSPHQSGVGNIAVVVDLTVDGSVASASSRGGRLQGLNTCVAQLAERLATQLSPKHGPGRLSWTVSYQD